MPGRRLWCLSTRGCPAPAPSVPGLVQCELLGLLAQLVLWLLLWLCISLSVEIRVLGGAFRVSSVSLSQ